MDVHRRILLTVVLAFLGSSVQRVSAEHNQSDPSLRSMGYSPRSAAEARVWQADVRARLLRLLKMDDLIATRSSISFDSKEILHAHQETYHVKEIEINSTSARRMRIVVTVPNATRNAAPAVVCVGGHGSDLYSPYDPQTPVGKGTRRRSDHIYKGFATVLSRLGYVTISTTVSQHQTREKGRLLMGERLWDLIRCVDYLQSMPQVDGSRIGCAGLSLGGEMAMWLGAMDERISVTVSSGFLTTMNQMEQNHCMCWKFHGLRELVDFADIYSLIAPRPLQCQNGLLEPASQFYVPLAREAMEEVRIIYKDLGRPENVVLDVHGEGHVIDLPALVSFFEKHLNNNRWRPIEVSGM